MAEYVDLEAAFNAITDFAGKASTRSAYEAIWKSARALKKIPAADVAPVRHGRWEKQRGIYSCSECGMTCPYDVQADVIEYWACNYCPNCGAKMNGGDSDAAD